MTNKPTKRYHLILMYPSSNSYSEHQTKKLTIDANNYHSGGGVYKFVDNGNAAIASYPTNFTIIEKIENLEG